MTPSEFIAKWRMVELTERSASQQHFLDVCALLGHPTPAEADPTGEWFTFERGAARLGAADGWADVWKRDHFGWEYKGKHRDLDAAYRQLLEYREDLGNPPLLVVCDMDRIVVRTNFTSTKTARHDIPLAEIGTARNLDILRAVFSDPEKLRPDNRRETITQEASARIAAIAQKLRDRGIDPHEVARFLDRVVFCLFAEDVGLLPERLFSRLLENSRGNPAGFQRRVAALFHTMSVGGEYGNDDIRWFNGNLFDDGPTIELLPSEIESIRKAATLDWSAIDPSILGTLFERGLDPDRRAQLGAHYTSREDIVTLVEPVVMTPLRREWEQVRDTVEHLLVSGEKEGNGARKKLTRSGVDKARAEADIVLQRFMHRLAGVKVLDPACGSGNFLFVTLQLLKDLELQVIEYALSRDIPGALDLIGPWQLYGIEVNRYAHDLAQMTVWIGYLQWLRDHGHAISDNPVLRRMDNFRRMDAILDLSDPANPREPEWPQVDFIVGNPPFLGGKLLRSVLGDQYVDLLFDYWRDRVRPESDYCCYWFEKARTQIEAGKCKRAGLLATQGIRGGANRDALKRIKATGDIFFAVSDRAWILNGANVHISMIGFDGGIQTERVLDGRPVATVNTNLASAEADITRARALRANLGISFMGDTKGGAFDISRAVAEQMLPAPNPHGRPNSDVLVPWVNGADLTGRSRHMFIVDFGMRQRAEDCAPYQRPYAHVAERVRPAREANKRDMYRLNWWRHVEPRPAMVDALARVSRLLATTTVSKHRLFVWLSAPTLPDHQLIVFARDDDHFFGVLHSRAHELWARAQGTQLRERVSGFRYTPTTCFETFPFPQPTPEQEAAIAEAARELDALRQAWLNPPEWVREEVLEFPGSVDGPWARYVHDPDARGIGTVRWPRLVPRDDACAALLARRTLTNLYNERPAWLDNAHRKLDTAVFAAYGWPADLPDGEVIARLLALNLERAAEEEQGAHESK